jgi:formiminotetrahydrofolate cyclodeaminase
LTGAGLNVRINVQNLSDLQAAESLLDSLQNLELRAAAIETQIRATIHERGGF